MSVGGGTNPGHSAREAGWGCGENRMLRQAVADTAAAAGAGWEVPVRCLVG